MKIRLAKADHIPAIAELALATGQELGSRMTTIIRDGVMGSAHRAGLAARGRERRQEAFSRALAEAAGRVLAVRQLAGDTERILHHDRGH